MKFNEKDILILDIETGGLEKEKCGITQITMMKFGNSEIFFNEYLKPCPNFEYKKEALEKQKISIEFLEKKGKEPIEVFRNMFSWIEKNFCNKPIFAGQNILAFDLPYLDYHINEFMRPMNFSNIGHYKKIDLLLVTPLLDRFGIIDFEGVHNLEKIREKLEIEVPEDKLHNSYYDCLVVEEAINKLIETFK